MEDQILTYALVEELLQVIEKRWPSLKPEITQVRNSIPNERRASTQGVTPEIEGAFNELARSLEIGDTDCVFTADPCWPIWRARGGRAMS